MNLGLNVHSALPSEPREEYKMESCCDSLGTKCVHNADKSK